MEFSSKYHEETYPDSYAAKHGASLFRRLNDRCSALAELSRTTSRRLIVSLWTDGNYKACRL